MLLCVQEDVCLVREKVRDEHGKQASVSPRAAQGCSVQFWRWQAHTLSSFVSWVLGIELRFSYFHS